MTATPADPEEIPRFEVEIFDADERVSTAQFSTLEAAEAHADASTDEAPGRRAVITDLLHRTVLDEEIRADTALAEDYPRPDLEE